MVVSLWAAVRNLGLTPGLQNCIVQSKSVSAGVKVSVCVTSQMWRDVSSGLHVCSRVQWSLVTGAQGSDSIVVSDSIGRLPGVPPH